MGCSLRGTSPEVNPVMSISKLPGEPDMGGPEPQAASGYPRYASLRSPLLAARGLRKSFDGQLVLGGVDLELHEGEVVLLRGENGSGKTTLLNILTGNLEPDAGEIRYLADATPRTYPFPRRWWQALNSLDHFTPEFVAQEGMGRTWQDVRLFGAQSLRDNIVVADPNQPGERFLDALLRTKRAARHEEILTRRADAALLGLGLAGRERSSADKISLGQAKRVAIARAVATGARILFLDEPLAGLDGQGIDGVLGMLTSLVRKEHLTLVIVEHVFNHSYLRNIITTDWLLEDGRLNRNGMHSWHESRSAASGTALGTDWRRLLIDDEAEVLEEELTQGAVLTRIRRRDPLNMPRRPVLEVQGLVVTRGPRLVLGSIEAGEANGFDLVVFDGEMVVLQAPNGWGKSTLFEALTGLIQIERERSP